MEGGIAVTPLGAIYISELATSFSPIDLFQNNEQGAWYDPSDLTTMFQDSAGTIPVTADGQPVGLILDKSGRNNHASQATAASRPVLRQDGNGKYYLEFDGVDDSLALSANILAACPISTFYGGLSAAIATNQTVWSTSRYICGLNLSKSKFTTVGTLDYYPTAPTLSSNTAYVNTVVFDTGFDCKFRTNAANEELVLGSLDSSSASANMTVGTHSGSAHLYGRIYSLIVRGALSTPQEITDTETWVAAKTGVTLP
jgi:hypothetical protein